MIWPLALPNPEAHATLQYQPEWTSAPANGPGTCGRTAKLAVNATVVARNRTKRANLRRLDGRRGWAAGGVGRQVGWRQDGTRAGGLLGGRFAGRAVCCGHGMAAGAPAPTAAR